MAHLRTGSWLGLTLAVCGGALLGANRPQATVDARLTGVAVDDAGRTLGRVLTGLRSVAGSWERTAVSRDDGTFEFSGVPAGAYTLVSTKTGYVTAVFGQQGPGRPPAVLQVRPPDRLSVTMQLVRYGSIAGVVRSTQGLPKPFASVVVMPVAERGWNSAFEYRSPSTISADEFGTYRAFGLAPGDYVVRTAGTTFEVHQIDAQGRERTWTEPPTFFPGSPRGADADLVRVRPGEERSGIDLTVLRLSTSRITGTIAASDQSPITGERIYALDPSDVLAPASVTLYGAITSGQFAIERVPAGPRLVVAQAMRRAQFSAPGLQLWGEASVQTDGTTPVSTAISLEPGAVVSGRVAFEGAGAKPGWLSVAARLTSGPFRIFSTLFNGGANPDGTLAIEGLPPGTYALDVRSGRTNPTWWPLSALANGVDLLDTDMEIQHASLGGVVLTMTDAPAKLSGTVIGSDGAPMFRCSVVVFAADRRYWTAASRRVVAAVPDTSGSFEFVNLPPGDYLATAVVDWNLEGLSALVPKATPVTIRRGEAKTVRLQGLAR